MAVKDLLIKIGVIGGKKAKKEIGGLSGDLTKLAKTAGIATAAFYGSQKLISGIVAAADASSRFEQSARGFDNLRRSVGFSADSFQKLKNATDNTVDSITLMEQANSAMLLGIFDSDEQMATMFDTAQRLGNALGVDTVRSVESLVTGLGRQSKLMLDNLGIMFDVEKANKDYAASIKKTSAELTDQERKQAFVNAAMESASELLKGVGEEQLTTSDRMAQLNNSFTDLTVSVGDLFRPAVDLAAGALTGLINIANDGITSFNNLGVAVEGSLLTPTQRSEIAINKFKEGLDDMSQGALERFINKTNNSISAMENSARWVDKETEEYMTFEGQLKLAEAQYGKLIAKEKNSVESKEEVLQRMAAERDLRKEGLDIDSAEIANLSKKTELYQRMIESFKESDQEIRRSTEGVLDYNTQLADIPVFLGAASSKTKDFETMATSAFFASGKAAGGIGNVLEETGTLASALAGEDKKRQIAAMRIMQAAALARAYQGSVAAFKTGDLISGAITAAGITAQGIAQVALIEGQIQQVQSIQAAAFGADKVVNKPTLFLTGEAGPEQVSVTPLTPGMNKNGPQGGVTINIQGNMIGNESFVRDTLIPEISKATQRGLA